MIYIDNLHNGLLNKYKKKWKKNIVSSTFRLMVIQISLSLDNPSKTVKLEQLQITWKFNGLWWTIKQ
jgi:hypothetical protein